MADLALRDIRKSYGDTEAVRGVSIDAPSGAFVVLVGPSGCGKSTLLRAIAGLEDISAGEILLGGRDIARLEPRDRNIAMVFQSYALYPYLSVRENIAFGLTARKYPRAEIAEKVRWAAELLDITACLDRRPRELSGGQRQRVAIGRAIVRDADLYLFDEPLSNLDAKLRDGMREEIKRLHRRLGKTFVYVTHDQVEAMTLADRIVLLRDGRIEQTGAPLDLFERPANTFVASFLGSPSINLIPVEITGAGARLHLPGGTTLDTTAAGRVPDGPYLWGVRPEHFRIADPPEGAISATIDLMQPTGPRSFASFRLGETEVMAEIESRTPLATGDTAPLAVALPRTLLFAPATGAVIPGWP